MKYQHTHLSGQLSKNKQKALTETTTGTHTLRVGMPEITKLVSEVQQTISAQRCVCPQIGSECPGSLRTSTKARHNPGHLPLTSSEKVAHPSDGTLSDNTRTDGLVRAMTTKPDHVPPRKRCPTHKVTHHVTPSVCMATPTLWGCVVKHRGGGGKFLR